MRAKFSKLFLIYLLGALVSNLTSYAQKTELVVQTGHSSGVTAIALSGDGRLLASSTQESIKIWDVKNKKEVRSIAETLAYPFSLSPNGKIVAYGVYGNSIKLRDVLTGKEIKSLTGHTDIVWSVAFSPDGKTLASGSWDNTIKLWDIESGRLLKTLTSHSGNIMKVAISPNGTTLISASRDKTIKLWDIETGTELRSLSGHLTPIETMAVSSDGKTIVSVSEDRMIKIWNADNGRELNSYMGSSKFYSLAFSPDDKTIAYGGLQFVDLIDISNGRVLRKLKVSDRSVDAVMFGNDGKFLISDNEGTIGFLDIESGKETASLSRLSPAIHSLAFSPSGNILASGSSDGIIRLWQMNGNDALRIMKGHSDEVSSLSFSPDGKVLASSSRDKTIKLWNVETGKETQNLRGHTEWVHDVSFSPDGTLLASCGDDKTVRLWNPQTGKELFTFRGHSEVINSIAFSPDGKTLASGSNDKTIKLWSVESGTEIRTLVGHAWFVWVVEFIAEGKLLASAGLDKTVRLWDVGTGKELKLIKNQVPLYSNRWIEKVFLGAIAKNVSAKQIDESKIVLFSPKGDLATLVALGEDDWAITTPDGRFDTNKPLDQIEGLHWIVDDEILKPLPLDVFMRQYYEPGLLQRVLANEQFKALPAIADINRVQPKVTIREIKPAANASDLADVKVEVDSVTEDISISATDRTKKTQLISGVFDLRLFRDGQLIGGSTPPGKLARYNEKSIGVSDAEEIAAWREANDVANLKDVKFDANGKATFTFHNVKLPRNSKKQTEFSAYAFNADRVKSNTDRRTFDLPVALSSAPRKGRAFLVTIGVNASDNPAYNLRYAANDARKMQEIVGEHLRQSGKYAEVIQVPLISDNEPGKETNTARKEIIKGVFSLLAGHRDEAERVIKLIPNAPRIKAVEPEDTLIIAFSGHGYADRNGIFYMLPADIPTDTRKLTAEALKRTISSDELGLWMRDITAKEMLMIVDACHSAAAVQGKDFKPGPMGSRGLGQLAYDKGMRILAATQADNVALELEKLQQGLLSYALVKEGIMEGKADTEVEFKQLTAAEWLGFAVKAVPHLYEDIRAGKKGVLVDEKELILGRKDTDVLIDLSGNQQITSGVNLQQPSLFDFRKKKIGEVLFNLP
ncbi:MAG: hypothetical protein QOJ64_2315 [Acidobacteriota bacterium]|jgi:WD40 repeat protein|nr:hypothetical protein [Acidobacteriota bacterium]